MNAGMKSPSGLSGQPTQIRTPEGRRAGHPSGKQTMNHRTPIKIAAIYFAFGVLWILVSDRLVERLCPTPECLVILQTLKGWVFILITAILIYALVRRDVFRLIDSRAALAERDLSLSLTERLLEAVIDQSPIPMSIVSSDGTLERFNEACRRQLGVEDEPEIRPGVNFYEVNHTWTAYTADGEPIPEHDLPVVKALRGEPTLDGELRIVTKTGAERWLSIHSVPVVDADGRIIAGFMAFPDITARKQAEDALKVSERRFSDITNRAPAVIYVKDPSGRYTFANRYFENLSGLSAKMVVGRTDADLFPPEVAERSTENDRVVIRTGKPMEKEEIGPVDGEMHTFISVKFPLLDDAGNIREICGISTDITERKRAERDLAESEDFHRQLFEHSPIALYIQDFSAAAASVAALVEAGVDDLAAYLREHPGEVKRLARQVTISKVNRAALDLYGIQSIADLTNLSQAIIISDCRHVIDQLVALCGDAEHWEGEARNRTPDGRTLELIIRKAVIHRGERGLSKVLVSLTDLTAIKQAERERNRLEDRLRQARKMEAIGTLAGGIAHDFNNLLMGIQGNVSMMLVGLGENDPIHSRLTSIERYIENGAGLTGQLLGFARGGKYEVRPIDVNNLLQNSLEIFARTHKELTVSHCLADELPPVAADRTQLEQVLLNLFINAWQAMPEGGKLMLETVEVDLDARYVQPFGIPPGRYVRISVTDTGVGMDRKTQERIFDPFFTTKETTRGTGLGLASAYGIIKNHGGIITVYSEPKQGTTFHIYLPPADADVAHDLPEIDDTVVFGTETILLVDDEESILEVGAEMLRALGYTVRTAPDGASALAQYEADGAGIDLVILDMIMPVMPGAAVFKRLREVNPNAAVLLSSGYSINGQASDLLRLGCNGFIQKPFKMADLSRKVREIIDSRRPGQ